MDGLITFIIITLLIIIVPGPDFIIVMKNTINSSKMNGFMAAFGITTGHILYSSLAIFGIIYILTSLHFVFLTIKIFIFQYIKLLFSRPRFKAIFDYIVGFVLIGLSINLLLSKSS